MQPEALQDCLGVVDHLFQFFVALVWMHHFDELHLVELVDPDHAPGTQPSGTGLGPEAGRVGAVAHWQLLLSENFLSMDVGHRSLRRRQQVQFAHRRGVESLLHGIGLIPELRKLPHADHAVFSDDVRRGHFGVAVFPLMEVEQEVNERPLQPSSPACVQKKARSAQLGSPGKVNELEPFAKFHVVVRRELEGGLQAMHANLRIVGRILTQGDARVGQVGDHE